MNHDRGLDGLAERLWDESERFDDHPWTDAADSEFGETLGYAAAILGESGTFLPDRLDWEAIWGAWLAYNDRATKAGSGFTGDQITGASAFSLWPRTILAPEKPR